MQCRSTGKQYAGPAEHRSGGNIRASQQSGFTLLEVQFASAAGLLIALTLVSLTMVFIQASVLAATGLEGQSRISAASEILLQELRRAGYGGCAELPAEQIVLLDTGTWEWNPLGPGLELGRTTDGEQLLTLRYGLSAGTAELETLSTVQYTVGLASPGEFSVGDIVLLVAADCAKSLFFQVTADRGRELYFGPSTWGVGVCRLSARQCSALAAIGGSDFTAGSRLFKWRLRQFFVAADTEGIPTLVRRDYRSNGAGVSSVTQKLVQGIERLTLSVDEHAPGETAGVRVGLVSRSLRKIPFDAGGDGFLRRELNFRVMLNNLDVGF